MIGALIDKILLSQVVFGHSLLLTHRDSNRKAVLYSSAHCCAVQHASLNCLARLTFACDDLIRSHREPSQALIPLDALMFDVATSVLRPNVPPVSCRNAAVVGYAFVVANERSALLYGLARCDCDVPFSLDEANRLQLFAPTVWGALNDCLRLTHGQEPVDSSRPLAQGIDLEWVAQDATFDFSVVHVLDEFIRARGTKLSPREIVVARQCLAGNSAKGIASELHISPHTINIHMRLNDHWDRMHLVRVSFCVLHAPECLP